MGLSFGVLCMAKPMSTMHIHPGHHSLRVSSAPLSTLQSHNFLLSLSSKWPSLSVTCCLALSRPLSSPQSLWPDFCPSPLSSLHELCPWHSRQHKGLETLPSHPSPGHFKQEVSLLGFFISFSLTLTLTLGGLKSIHFTV